jgi:Fe-S cluster biogenesis protein NfuA
MAATAPNQHEDLLQKAQELQERLDATGDAPTARIADELLSTVIEMYGEGLRRIVATLNDDGEHGQRLAAQLAGDDLVASLLLIHDLHPVSLHERVLAALEQVRPYMESHGGNVELLALEDGVARLRLQGSCSSCAASAVTLELAIKQALEASAPDLAGLEVEGVSPPLAADPLPPQAAGPSLPLAASPPRAGNGGLAPEAVELPIVPSGPARASPSASSARVMPPRGAGEERCDLCGTTVAPDHRHLLNLVERKIECSCESCWALRSGDPEYRPTSTRTLWLDDFKLTDDVWASFQIPIGLAFFMRSTTAGCIVALYPSPAGATESELHFSNWNRLVSANPVLADLEADVEGLIVNRMADPPVYAIAPIDRCYELTGTIKVAWEGISGGAGVSDAITHFFEGLQAQALAA